ncbi:MAG: archease [Methanomassiliicoccales archaeon]|nr:archease [Methanomassiliicoccales archaeon]
MKYRTLDHTADVMVEAFGADLEECFANAAYALTDQMLDASKVRPDLEKYLEVEGHDHESMLYNFLSELLFVFDVTGMVFSKFSVRLEGDKVLCRAWGEVYDPGRHDPKKEVKAITYHMMSVDPATPLVRVVFDI